MKQWSEDQSLILLRRCFDDRVAHFNMDLMIILLGDINQVGDFEACVLNSRFLLGWHREIANNLYGIVVNHETPSREWIEALWDYGRSTIMSCDCDGFLNILKLISVAKSDSIREWLTEPLVKLCEMKDSVHSNLGFNGLIQLACCGGGEYVKKFETSLKKLTNSPNQTTRDSALYVLGLL